MTGLQDTLPQPNPRSQRLSRKHPRRHQRVPHGHHDHDSEESDSSPPPIQQHSPAARSGGVKLNPGDQHNTRTPTTRVSPSIQKHAPLNTSSRRRRKHGQLEAGVAISTDASTRFNTTSEEEEDEEDSSTDSDTDSDTNSAGSLLLNITTNPHATITPSIAMQRWAAAGNADDGTGNTGTGTGTGNAGNAPASRHSRQSSAWSRSSEIEKGFRRGRQGSTTGARPAVPQGNPRGRK
ncbi:hypothetical protein KEM55_007959, partial [Ascosphaera atra]